MHAEPSFDFKKVEQAWEFILGLYLRPVWIFEYLLVGAEGA